MPWLRFFGNKAWKALQHMIEIINNLLRPAIEERLVSLITHGSIMVFLGYYRP